MCNLIFSNHHLHKPNNTNLKRGRSRYLTSLYLTPNFFKAASLNRYFLESNTRARISLGHGNKAAFYHNCKVCGLNTHSTSQCTNYYCQICGLVGHMSWQCPAQHLEACEWCQRKGHGEKSCRMRDLLDLTNADLSQVECFVCGVKGHVVCNDQEISNWCGIIELFQTTKASQASVMFQLWFFTAQRK